MNKKHRWAIQNKKTKKYYGSGDGDCCTKTLKNCILFVSREEARSVRNITEYPKDEAVCKIVLSKNGKPYKVLKRGQ